MDYQVSLTSEKKVTELKVTEISVMDSLKERNSKKNYLIQRKKM